MILTTKRRLLVLLLAGGTLFGAATDTKTDGNPALTALDLQKVSLKKQVESIRQQIGIKVEATNSDFEFLMPPTLVPDAGCAALSRDDAEALIASAAKKESLQPELVRAVMRQESGFKPCAVSTKGAEGLMQLMPATAVRFQVTDPFDPTTNAMAGAAYLKELMGKYKGDLRLALVAYNAGPLKADQLDPSKYPLETQDYLAAIFAEIGTPETAKPKTQSASDPNGPQPVP
ncbi:MAG TPA: lytic transglycosylase domain-containing protein [Bryobacteraceae bacterium]|nr:lytic transglycosylase domain-containing protein [Bryobacteraceae bacterium]